MSLLFAVIGMLVGGMMFQFVGVQTSFTIFWSLLALCAMVVAVRRELRTVWMAGAGLLGVVVFKLFLVDLAGHGTVERIVSFVAVGLLLLVIGWFAPLPPRAAQTIASSDQSDQRGQK